MHVELGRHFAVDGLEELLELDSSVPAMQLADHLTGRGVKGSEQGGGSVTDVVVGGSLRCPGQHRKQ